MREHHDLRGVAAAAQIVLYPGELRLAESDETTLLEREHVNEPDEVHTRLIEAVIALVAGDAAEAVEVFRDRRFGSVMLARYGVYLARAQPSEELLREVEFRRPRQVRDVARVDNERRLIVHRVDEVDRLVERPVDVRIRLFAEADVRVADLHE